MFYVKLPSLITILLSGGYIKLNTATLETRRTVKKPVKLARYPKTWSITSADSMAAEGQIGSIPSKDSKLWLPRQHQVISPLDKYSVPYLAEINAPSPKLFLHYNTGSAGKPLNLDNNLLC